MKLNLRIQPTIHIKKRRSTAFKIVSLILALISATTVLLVFYYHVTTEKKLREIKESVTGIEGTLTTSLFELKTDEAAMEQFTTLTDDVTTINEITADKQFPWLSVFTILEKSLEDCVIERLIVDRKKDLVTGKVSGYTSRVDSVSSFIDSVHTATAQNDTTLLITMKVTRYQVRPKTGGLSFTIDFSSPVTWPEALEKATERENVDERENTD